MIWLVIVAVIMASFGLVLFVGAPYLPTLKKQRLEALDLLSLKPGQTMLELGCGDGRMLSAAARRGVKTVGYELNPVLFLVAKVINWRYRQLVTVVWGDYWSATWPPCNGIYVFLMDRYMTRLDTKITQLNCKNIKLVTFAFKIPGKKVVRESGGLYLYKY